MTENNLRILRIELQKAGYSDIESDTICKGFGSDLMKQFPNGSWKTINGARVFIDGGKVVAGLDGFNGKIEDAFKKKEEPKEDTKPVAPEKPEILNKLRDGKWNGKFYGKNNDTVYLNSKATTLSSEDLSSISDYRKAKESFDKDNQKYFSEKAKSLIEKPKLSREELKELIGLKDKINSVTFEMKVSAIEDGLKRLAPIGETLNGKKIVGYSVSPDVPGFESEGRLAYVLEDGSMFHETRAWRKEFADKMTDKFGKFTVYKNFENDSVEISFPYDAETKDKIKNEMGGRFDPESKNWTVSGENVKKFYDTFNKNKPAEIDNPVLRDLKQDHPKVHEKLMAAINAFGDSGKDGNIVVERADGFTDKTLTWHDDSIAETALEAAKSVKKLINLSKWDIKSIRFEADKD